jgi:hypothetical protein
VYNIFYIARNFQTIRKAWKEFVGSYRISEEKVDKMRDREYLGNRPFTHGATIAAPPKWSDHAICTFTVANIRLDRWHSACENSYLTLPNEIEESFQ